MNPMLEPDKLDLVLLARIGAPARTSPSAGEVARAVFPLVEDRVSRSDWNELVGERIAALRERGLVEGDGLRLTEAGRERVTSALGIDSVPAWRVAKSKILVALALGLDWSSAQTRRRLGDADGVRARLLKQHHDLPIAETPTLNQAVDALVWRHLGVDTDEKLTLGRLKAHVLRQVLGTDARLDDKKLAWLAAAQAAGTAVTHADKLRTAVLGSWLAAGEAAGTSAAADQVSASTTRPSGAQSQAPAAGTSAHRASASIPSGTPGPAPAAAPAATGHAPEVGGAPARTWAPAQADDLVGFARQVLDAARAVEGSGRFGSRKVFISAAWRTLQAGTGGALDLDRFKHRLVEANRAGLLRLHRADLVAAMDPAEVRASEVAHLNATFHFIECEQEGVR